MSRGRRPLQPTPSGQRAYMYTNPAVPTYQTIWGFGNKANNRADLRPSQKRILIDGTTSTVGNYVHVATWAAAKAVHAAGDWILFQGGSTTTIELGELLSSGLTPLSGVSMANPTVIGTFDPAHNTNAVGDEQYYNTLRVTFNMTGKGAGFQWAYYTRATPLSYIAFVNLNIIAGIADSSIKFDL